MNKIQQIKVGDYVKILDTQYSHKQLIGERLKVDRIIKKEKYDFNPEKVDYYVGFFDGKNFLSLPTTACVKLNNYE